MQNLKVKKIKIKPQVIVLAVSAITAFNAPASAGVFEQMAVAASSSFSREYMMNTRPELSDDQAELAIKEVIELGSDRVVEIVTQVGRYDTPPRLSADLRKAKRLAARRDYRDQFLKFEQQINDATVALAPAMNGLLKNAVVLEASGATDSSEAIGSVIQFDDMLSRLMVDHVVEQSMKSFFLELELQEQEIRQNPSSRSTALLRDVFQ